jgi:hypothetical protein
MLHYNIATSQQQPLKFQVKKESRGKLDTNAKCYVTAAAVVLYIIFVFVVATYNLCDFLCYSEADKFQLGIKKIFIYLYVRSYKRQNELFCVRVERNEKKKKATHKKSPQILE